MRDSRWVRAWYGSPILRERLCGGAAGDIGRAMQLGFNTNFRYRDLVFHVQTEDSGRANPHVITHLFHGGNILASVKSDYSDLLVADDLESAVRKLMETQHKAMLKQLSKGDFDGVIRERLGPELFRADSGGVAGGVARIAPPTTVFGDIGCLSANCVFPFVGENVRSGRGRPVTASSTESLARVNISPVA